MREGRARSSSTLGAVMPIESTMNAVRRALSLLAVLIGATSPSGSGLSREM